MAIFELKILVSDKTVTIAAKTIVFMLLIKAVTQKQTMKVRQNARLSYILTHLLQN